MTRIFAALALITLIATPSQTQAIVRVNVAPEVGRYMLQLDLGRTGALEDNSGDKGFAWSAGWSYHADNTLGFGITIGSNPAESNVSLSNGYSLDFKYDYLTATVHVRTPTRSAFFPHLQAGFGYYKLTIDEFLPNTSSPAVSVNNEEFGMFFGIGVDYLIVSNLSIGIIGNFHYISLDQSLEQTQGLGDWYDTWDVKGVITLYGR